jgi:hypothetical protein
MGQVTSMPLKYLRDDTRRRIRITLTDPVSVADLIASVERQFADGDWSYGLLVDGRGLLDTAKPTDVREFVSRVRELIAAHGPRGPVAFVARKSGVIAAAQLSNFLGGKAAFVEVFWDVDDALQWLDERMAQSGT